MADWANAFGQLSSALDSIQRQKELERGHKAIEALQSREESDRAFWRGQAADNTTFRNKAYAEGLQDRDHSSRLAALHLAFPGVTGDLDPLLDAPDVTTASIAPTGSPGVALESLGGYGSVQTKPMSAIEAMSQGVASATRAQRTSGDPQSFQVAGHTYMIPGKEPLTPKYELRQNRQGVYVSVDPQTGRDPTGKPVQGYTPIETAGARTATSSDAKDRAFLLRRIPQLKQDHVITTGFGMRKTVPGLSHADAVRQARQELTAADGDETLLPDVGDPGTAAPPTRNSTGARGSHGQAGPVKPMLDPADIARAEVDPEFKAWLQSQGYPVSDK
jgi:hypothetical protein